MSTSITYYGSDLQPSAVVEVDVAAFALSDPAATPAVDPLAIVHETVAAYGPDARLLHVTADGYITFALATDPDPRRLHVTRADAPQAWALCDTYSVPTSIPVSDLQSVIGYSIARIDALRALPELGWVACPDDVLARVLVRTIDGAVVSALVAQLT